MTKFSLPGALKLIVALLAIAASVAHAQKLPTATAPGASITVGATYSAVEAQYPPGVQYGAGGYVDLNFHRSFGIEGEARLLREHTSGGSHQSTFLAGPRIELHYGRFSPYAKALVGDGKLVFVDSEGYGNYLVVAGGAGLDISLSENLKLRLIDFEYQDWPTINTGPIQSIAPYGVSAGISYRFLHTGGWRRHHYR